MEMYFVNKSAQIGTGEHKIHTYSCTRRPKDKNIKELGEFENSRLALYEASKYYICVNGCKYCSKDIYLKK